MRPLAAHRSGPLRGSALVPGDKSISHRALILGSLAVGETRISGLLEADDVLDTAKVMRLLGSQIVRTDEDGWRVWGVGTGGFAEPNDVLDFGNSGTGSRLVMGAAATTPISAVFTGDVSLRRRPMKRVLEPLTRFGAEFHARDDGLMPIALCGAAQPFAIQHEVAVASAQVKSALLLAALNAPGRTLILQRALTRDHTEKMLEAFGADICTEAMPDGGEVVSLDGEIELRPAEIGVPRDPSSASFLLAAALIVPDSDIHLPGILLNPRRTGLIRSLCEMGANIAISNERESARERVGDIAVQFSQLKGIEVPPERAPSMIDEYPVLAVIAAFAEGRTVIRGVEELRVKESDRLSAVAQGLRVIGAKVEELPDGLIIEGRGPGGVRGGGRIVTQMDHRIAMSFLVAGLATSEPVIVDDIGMIGTSFPKFRQLMRNLGADFRVPVS